MVGWREKGACDVDLYGETADASQLRNMCGSGDTENAKRFAAMMMVSFYRELATEVRKRSDGSLWERVVRTNSVLWTTEYFYVPSRLLCV